MKPEEIHENKRRNFVEKVNALCSFLCTEFGYIGPEHRFSRQDNGTVICDELIYKNEKIDRQISFYNGYHPVDYGFEIQFYMPSISTEASKREMVHYVLKEDQDIEQTYMYEAINILKEKYVSVILGESWINCS